MRGPQGENQSINPDQIKRVASILKISVHELLFDEPDSHDLIGEEILKEIFSGDVRITLHRTERRKKVVRRFYENCRSPWICIGLYLVVFTC